VKLVRITMAKSDSRSDRWNLGDAGQKAAINKQIRYRAGTSRRGRRVKSEGAGGWWARSNQFKRDEY
jgi:hypothetical protein